MGRLAEADAVFDPASLLAPAAQPTSAHFPPAASTLLAVAHCAGLSLGGWPP